jgi:outer membrane protein W
MMKIIVSFLLICFLFIPQTYSQIRLSVQPGLQIPSGAVSDNAGLGFGGLLTFEFSRKADINYYAAVGFYLFGKNEDLPSNIDYSLSDIPIVAGARYYLAKSDFRPYFGIEAGLHLVAVSINYGTEVKAEDAYFGFSPFVGFKTYLSRTMDLDINVKYNSVLAEGESINYIGMNFGLQFLL